MENSNNKHQKTQRHSQKLAEKNVFIYRFQTNLKKSVLSLFQTSFSNSLFNHNPIMITLVTVFKQLQVMSFLLNPKVRFRQADASLAIFRPFSKNLDDNLPL